MHVLVLEDDPELGPVITRGLREAGSTLPVLLLTDRVAGFEHGSDDYPAADL
ncbi:DNA-binding response OmpR family regulator [Kitasatospora sp. MAP12-15]|uniref:hypothetical protein n=1 Tax=unclassified Kitasatospora TaxID=2633591 RepID=UPI0024730FD0|nr:hypothetical protein [Kitasatospora sp. MAP12-44]MDH6113651.1 DNA-binding response OmpR family regulator [Kitasatospora sp. MAP12-44]